MVRRCGLTLSHEFGLQDIATPTVLLELAEVVVHGNTWGLVVKGNCMEREGIEREAGREKEIGKKIIIA